MGSRDGTPPRYRGPSSIPLQDLARPPDAAASSGEAEHVQSRHGRTRSLLNRHNRSSTYARLQDDSPSRSRPRPANTRYEGRAQSLEEEASLEDARDFASASMGLALDFEPSEYRPSTPPTALRRPTIITTPAEANDYGETTFSPPDNDMTPLTGNRTLKPSLNSSSSTNKGQRHDRNSRRSSVQWLDGASPSNGRGRSVRLGDDLPRLDTGAGAGRKMSSDSAASRLDPSSAERSRSRSHSPSPSPMARANSIFREISQRVVNLSNDTDMVEQSMRRKSTVHRAKSRRGTTTGTTDEEEGEEGFAEDTEAEHRAPSPLEKTPSVEAQASATPITPTPFLPPVRYPNPLRGRSWGIFGPENPLRKGLCEVLVHPVTEPIILVLIVAQAVLLAVNAASDAVYHTSRAKPWGTTGFDYAIFALFVAYTCEVVARTIVSGFISNPYEFSTIDRSLGLKQAILKKGQGYFAPQSEVVARTATATTDEEFQPSIVRTFTGLPDKDSPGHGKQQQRIRLARRAFMRHSFNRLDAIAVVSYWISFGLLMSGFAGRKHVFVFSMLSCLRIVRLLGLTAGTSVILRSLKKAAPLLVHVAFLICFFWLIFGIVGVQSFKSSLDRNCVWLGDEAAGGNYTQNVAPENIQFCGGYLNATTADPWPWLKSDGSNGTQHHKGYLCPQGSLCVESGNGPYNGTVSFDNIVQSLQLVFVIMSSNTFSDLLYYLTDTDYLIAALFFAAGIVVLSLWMINLLVAVITSSFQIIREESRQSAFQTEKIEDHDMEDETKPKSRVSGLRYLYDKTYYFWIVLIVFDLVVQCLRSSTMSGTRRKFIMDTETVVTFMLLFEVIVRFICDWRGFFRSKRNWADLIIAIVTTVIQLPQIRNSGQPYAWLTFFQIVRIYRVVLAVRVTRELVMIVFRNIGGLINLIIFVFLFTFIAAILASELFRGDFPTTDAAGDENRIQFFDIWNSFIGMYQILSSENWTTIMYDATQFDLTWDTAWLGAIFCILWFIIGNFIILNMFIAVIQESFDVSEDEKRLQQVKAFLRQKELSGGGAGVLSLSSIFRLGRDSMRHRDALEYGPAAMEQLLKDAVVNDFLDEQDHGTEQAQRPTSMHLTSFPTAAVDTGALSKVWGKITGLNTHREQNPFYTSENIARVNEDFDPRAAAKQVVSSAETRRKAQRQYLTRHPRYNVSLFIFGNNNPARRWCQYIVGPGRGEERIEGISPSKPVWYAFSAFTYAAIVAMVILACITTPLYQREYYQTHAISVGNWFVWVDLGFSVLFTVEAAIKIIADGFFFTPHAYYRSVWGFIDGVVLVTLWINVVTALEHDSTVSRAVGAFKALRALRLLNISDSARNTFHSVIVIGGYKVLAAAFVSMSLLVPFAILGLNIFNGQMLSCNDGDFAYTGLTNCVGEFNSTPFNWPVLAPRQVSNPYYNFDNFGGSLFILFQIVSQEGWIDVMWSAMSITGRGLQPQNFASQGNAVFFIIFNLLGAVFVLTLFISVFMRNYTEQTGVAFLTADQRSWLELRKLLRQISPSKRSLGEKSGSLRRWCYERSIKKRGKWQRFITILLLVHLSILIIEYYPEPKWWDDLREYIFLLFTLILMANIAIRVFGLSWKRFSGSTWDLYSLPAVLGTFATSFMTLGLSENRAIDQLHKLFLVSLVFLLIPRNNQLDQLFKTAAASLPLIANLLATWFVLFLVFAIALTQTFGLTRFGSNESGNLNFRNVPKALILLFRTSIGEGWNQIMEDFAMIEPPFCVQESSFFDSDCGSAAWARALFVAWNIISMYIFVSLFVSLIFESFSYVYQRSSGLSVVSRDEIRRFKQAWAEFDPKGTGWISRESFPRLLGVSMFVYLWGCC